MRTLLGAGVLAVICGVSTTVCGSTARAHAADHATAVAASARVAPYSRDAIAAQSRAAQAEQKPQAPQQSGTASGAQQQGSGPVLVNGRLNVPGAAEDSQTVPSKYSQRNAALDRLPTMATPLGLSAAQKRKIVASVAGKGQPAAQREVQLTQELPATVPLLDLPSAIKAEIPNIGHLKYVSTPDKIVLVDPPNRIVVAMIDK